MKTLKLFATDLRLVKLAILAMSLTFCMIACNSELPDQSIINDLPEYTVFTDKAKHTFQDAVPELDTSPVLDETPRDTSGSSTLPDPVSGTNRAGDAQTPDAIER